MIDQKRWFTFSLCEKMAHIGSEVSRARVWRNKNDQVSSDRCLERALDLIDLTKNDPNMKGRRKEVCCFREIVADQYARTGVFNESLESLEKYCTEFSLVARRSF